MKPVLMHPIEGDLVYGPADCRKNCVPGFVSGDRTIFLTVGAFGNVIRAETVGATDPNRAASSGATPQAPARDGHDARSCRADKTPDVRLVEYTSVTRKDRHTIRVLTQSRRVVTAPNGSSYRPGEIYQTGPIAEALLPAAGYDGPLDGTWRPANGAPAL